MHIEELQSMFPTFLHVQNYGDHNTDNWEHANWLTEIITFHYT